NLNMTLFYQDPGRGSIWYCFHWTCSRFKNLSATALCAPCKGAYVQKAQISPSNCYSDWKYFGVAQEATNGLKHSKKRSQ
ncbi:hypothetical protein, partial [Legionella pneumophila]|uniref:hypothetical protein n=1 Tax=Legionella pneumophila TaxID=446 RepID=UPI001F4897AE